MEWAFLDEVAVFDKVPNLSKTGHFIKFCMSKTEFIKKG